MTNDSTWELIEHFDLILLQAKLEIEVRARVNSKVLVVEEARRLNARYVVIDRYSIQKMHACSFFIFFKVRLGSLKCTNAS